MPGTLRRERPLPRLHGLGHALVLGPEFARSTPCWTRNRVVPPRVLRARRRPRLRNLLDDPPRCGGNGQQLRTNGSHCVRTPGAVGELACWLAGTVESARGRRPDAPERTSETPVGATCGGGLRRPPHGQVTQTRRGR